MITFGLDETEKNIIFFLIALRFYYLYDPKIVINKFNNVHILLTRC